MTMGIYPQEKERKNKKHHWPWRRGDYLILFTAGRSDVVSSLLASFPIPSGMVVVPLNG